jgi:UDP-glucose:(heptosyl)LPS alpha-1,3-glucosyltransferase
MKIAFGIVRLFRGGGLQSDCMRLAALLAQAGHAVRLFTARAEDGLPGGLEIERLPVKAWTNSGTDLAFAERFRAATQDRFDRVVGFNKLFGLDVLYCADPSALDRGRTWLTRMLPRHRTQLGLEAACFSPQSATRIIALTQRHADAYRRHWNLPAARIAVIPPGANRARRRPELRAEKTRHALRTALSLSDAAPVWLWVATQPETKGLDRVLTAMAQRPEAILIVAGVAEGDAGPWRQRAQAANAAERVRWLGYRGDIPELMAAADVLVHPARLDITGGVILEAIINGLPVVTTEVCGFAEHATAADAGIVLSEPFSDAALLQALSRIADPEIARRFSANGMRYGERDELYAGLEHAARLIEAWPEPTARVPKERIPSQ